MTVRRTHDADGRPLYRTGDIPTNLATQTMLKRMRRRPGADQEPAGTLFYHGNRHTPLYEIEAAEPMPPLVGSRAEAWTLARTCSRCGATDPQPFPRVDRKRRLCPRCCRAERYATVWPSWLAGRWAAVRWAREVLADPNTALVHSDCGQPFSVPTWPHDLYAATVCGQVLLDVTIWPKHPSASCQSRPARSVLAVDVAEQIHTLAARRLVAWQTGPLEFVRRELLISSSERPVIRPDLAWPALPWPAGVVDDGDWFGADRGRYTAWRHEPLPGHIWPGPDGLTRQGPTGGGNARQAVEQMATLLRLMAADDHPDGPPLCPVLPPTGVDPCGAAVGPRGRCADHEPPVGEAS